MNEKETLSSDNGQTIFEQGITELIHEQFLFAESVYARLPISIEMYDTDGILRFINDHALKMYGVNDRSAVVGTVNLFSSPYMDDQLKARIQSGEENIMLEFEYDFNRINEDEYFTTHNKNSMIFEVQVISLWNKAGNIIGHVLLSNDKTSVKETEFRTEENKKNLEMAMEAANMSSWVYDVRKKTFSSLHGTSIVKEKMTLDDFLDILHPQDCEQLRLVFSQLINKEIENGQITLRFFDEAEKQYRHYESRMRLSAEHMGKLLIIGTQLDITERLQMVKKTQELISKRELAMQVSNIIHWDFDVRTRKFESYHDPINDYASDKPLTIAEYIEAVHPDDRSAVYDAMQSMLSGKDVTINFTCRIQTKYDDSWQYCNILGVPFEKDEDGNNIRFTGFRQNISKLHQLDEEVKERNYKMELTFKTVGMSYWDFDVTTRQFKAFNDPVNDYHPERTITPNDYMEATHPEDVDCVCKYIEYMLQRTDKEFSFQYRSKSKWENEWQTLIVTGIPVERDKKGNVTRYTGIKFNNTKWEKMAQELKELKEKAELSDRLKSAFLANMSHEIRTPLNAIVGFSGILASTDEEEEKQEYVSIIENNNTLLLQLISDILDLSKIEAGTLEFQYSNIDLNKMLNELTSSLQLKIKSEKVQLTCHPAEENCFIHTEKNRLSQLLINLISNAIKFTTEGYIRFGYELRGKEIYFYVSDTGCGIPKDKQKSIFGRFVKLNSFEQGTGLGLSICQTLVEHMGGTIGVDSEEGKGSTFWFTLPYKAAIAVEESIKKEEIQPISIEKNKFTILIAEDNESNYKLFASILKGEYQLIHAWDGQEAVEMFKQYNPQIILMDINMPVMDGYEATKEIRKYSAKVPIIAITAFAYASDEQRVMESGFDGYMPKPINARLLKAQLTEIMQKRIILL